MNQKKKVSKRQIPLPQDAPKVLVSISLAHASWRDFFSGILRYVDEHANWDIRIAHEPGDLLAEQVDDAEREGFAVCYPQGEKDAKGKTGWNVGYDVQQGLERDDVGFVKALVKHLRKAHRIGKDNVFMSGMSNGGEMTYFMAYKYPDLFRAYATIAGLTMQWAYKEWKAKKPVPLMEVHGTADKTSMWEGDPTDTGGWGAYIAVPAAVGYWAAQARCTHEETTTLPQKGEHPVVLHRYLGGDDGIEVRLYEVQGAKHSWHLADMDTCEEMWAFFSRYLK